LLAEPQLLFTAAAEIVADRGIERDDRVRQVRSSQDQAARGEIGRRRYAAYARVSQMRFVAG